MLAERRSLRTRQLERAREERDGDALVFGTSAGTTLDAANARRAFRSALQRLPSITPDEWTPRVMRHSFVSLLSDQRREHRRNCAARRSSGRQRGHRTRVPQSNPPGHLNRGHGDGLAFPASKQESVQC